MWIFYLVQANLVKRTMSLKGSKSSSILDHGLMIEKMKFSNMVEKKTRT